MYQCWRSHTLGEEVYSDEILRKNITLLENVDGERCVNCKGTQLCLKQKGFHVFTKSQLSHNYHIWYLISLILRHG